MSQWYEGMCTMSALLHAGITEAPGAVETVIAVPVALVGESEAGLTERAFLQLPSCWDGRVETLMFRVTSWYKGVRPLGAHRPAFWRS